MRDRVKAHLLFHLRLAPLLSWPPSGRPFWRLKQTGQVWDLTLDSCSLARTLPSWQGQSICSFASPS